MSDRPVVPVALGLGSNLGESLKMLRAAVKALAPYIEITAVSSVYESSPLYVPDQPVFMNAALVGKTGIEPLALMWTIKDIEREIGRAPVYHYGPRMIDIDMIFYGDMVIKTPELRIPHAQMTEREFVLRPLNEIAPEWKHPESGRSVAAMLGQVQGGGMKCVGKVL
ncbi:MAG: 2-amino-4-hydroxy-6-hydroxymethyldihydropteridine diphosphokinase [Alphaproteobacteria bacterium]|nr:2-amino-4-hydroxy-6-hydroxymethyldihydropteridine diphosphokinase [Alphaproteobacteria bacterium]